MTTQIHELVHDLLAVKAREQLQRDLRDAQDEDDLDKIDQIQNVLFAPPIDPTPDDNTMAYYRHGLQARAMRTPIDQEVKRLEAFESALARHEWNPEPEFEATIKVLYDEALALVHGMDPRKWTRDPCLTPDIRDLIKTVLICKETPEGALRNEEEHNDWKVFLWLEYQDIRQWDYSHVELPPSEEDLLRPIMPEPYDGVPALYSLDVMRQRDCPKCFGNGHSRDMQLWSPDKSRSTPRQDTMGPNTRDCLSCEGTGKKTFGHKCWICQGTGQAEAQCFYCLGSGFDPYRSFKDPLKQREAVKVRFVEGEQVRENQIYVNLPSGHVIVTKPSKFQHGCPACDSPMWDNTEKNKQRVKEGKRMMPQHACCACSTVIWANGGLSYNSSPRGSWAK